MLFHDVLKDIILDMRVLKSEGHYKQNIGLIIGGLVPKNQGQEMQTHILGEGRWVSWFEPPPPPEMFVGLIKT